MPLELCICRGLIVEFGQFLMWPAISYNIWPFYEMVTSILTSMTEPRGAGLFFLSARFGRTVWSDRIVQIRVRVPIVLSESECPKFPQTLPKLTSAKSLKGQFYDTPLYVNILIYKILYFFCY